MAVSPGYILMAVTPAGLKPALHHLAKDITYRWAGFYPAASRQVRNLPYVSWSNTSKKTAWRGPDGWISGGVKQSPRANPWGQPERYAELIRNQRQAPFTGHNPLGYKPNTARVHGRSLATRELVNG